MFVKCTHPYAGSDAIADCLCRAGYHGPAGGPCTLCAAGSYCPGSLAPQTPCQANATSVAGSSNISACLCNNGFRDSTGTNVCLPCSSSPCANGLYRTDCTVLPSGLDLDSVCTLPCSAPGAAQTFTWTSGGECLDAACTEWVCCTCMLLHMHAIDTVPSEQVAMIPSPRLLASTTVPLHATPTTPCRPMVPHHPSTSAWRATRMQHRARPGSISASPGAAETALGVRSACSAPTSRTSRPTLASAPSTATTAHGFAMLDSTRTKRTASRAPRLPARLGSTGINVCR